MSLATRYSWGIFIPPVVLSLGHIGDRVYRKLFQMVNPHRLLSTCILVAAFVTIHDLGRHITHVTLSSFEAGRYDIIKCGGTSLLLDPSGFISYLLDIF